MICLFSHFTLSFSFTHHLTLRLSFCCCHLPLLWNGLCKKKESTKKQDYKIKGIKNLYRMRGLQQEDGAQGRSWGDETGRMKKV